MSSDKKPNSRLGAVREWVSANDLRMIIIAIVLVYVMVLVLSWLGGTRGVNGMLSRFRSVTILVLIYVMLTLALNLQWGYGGLLNLGVAGFMMIGVYTMALLTMPADASTAPGLGLPLPIGIVGGVLAATLLGALAALPAIRLKADYLAIVTLAFGEMIRLSIRSRGAAEFSVAGRTLGTGGTDSFSLPPNPVKWLLYEDPDAPSFIAANDPTIVGRPVFWIGDRFDIEPSIMEAVVYALMLAVLAAVFYLLLVRVGNSPFGRVLKAIREDEMVASSLGKDTRQFKIKAFALGCGLMGLAAIFQFLEGGGSVSATDFEPELTFFVFVALILGGSGSNTGSVIGAIIFAGVLLEAPNFIQRIADEQLDLPSTPDTIIEAFGGSDLFLAYLFSDTSISALQFIVLGGLLIYLMQRRPDGLLGDRIETASSVDLSKRNTEENR